MTEHDTADATKNVTFRYGYGKTVAASGTTPATTTQPHTMTGISSTPSGKGSAYTYDATGNTTVRDLPSTTQRLVWNPENKLDSITDDGNKTTYVYDAGGNRLLENSSSGSTLYLGDTELTTNASGTITKASRSYTQAGAPTVVRTTTNGATSGFKLPGGCKCFLAGTDVLMADGSTKNIEDVKLGDRVKATDPKTGKTKSRKVTRLIRTEGDKYFNELSIATKNGIEKLTATHEHPFWSPSEHDWTAAGALKPGMTLRTDDGSTVIVTGNRSFTKRARTYNLTVDELHTYYVLAGKTPVLVHNANCMNATEDDLFATATATTKGQLTAAGRALQKHGDPSPGNIAKRGQAHVDLYNFGKLTNSERSQVAEEIIQEILTNPSARTTIRPATAHYGGTVRDVRIPGGWGARWSMCGGSLNFEGFL